MYFDFCKKINPAFIANYKRTTGKDIKIDQAHGGSSAQARAVKAGLAAAKKKGKKFGRPDALNEKDKEMALAMFNGGATKIDISRHFNVTRQTIYTLLKEYET